ncbi:MAG: heavy metal translocating P-type ATPase [Luteolibacter sp.]
MDRKDHTIQRHEGILDVVPENGGERVSIAFDPQQLDEAAVREIVGTHFEPALECRGSGACRWVMRLDGEACEAAAARLEKRVEKVPGVRRAHATYIGRVLCLTFDPGVAAAGDVLRGVRDTGARVSALETAKRPHGPLAARVRAGEHNEEISCGLGLAAMVAAAALDKLWGFGVAANGLYAVSYFFGGQAGVRSAIASLRERTLDIDLLMVLAALGAAAVGAPFEGALLLFLFSFSNVLQRHAMDRTQRAIESLLTLRPDEAMRKSPDGERLVPIDSLVPGDVVIVRPGELLPTDGVIQSGGGAVDESTLTGESMPVSKAEGDAVFAGTLNQTGGLEVRVTRASGDSTLAKMVRLVAEAQAKKSTTQRFLEKAEQRYAAGVILFTIAVLFVPWWVFGEAFGDAFYRAMTVMVVASPCALIISTPATVLSAIGGAARRGILIKGGSHLESAARIEIVCLDKTGTLTHGRPAVTDILTKTAEFHLDDGEPVPADVASALRACAAIEARSEHPLATAITVAAKQHGIEVPEASAFQSATGMGAEADVEGVRHFAGSTRWFEEAGADGMDLLHDRASALQEQGKTCIWLGRRSGDGGAEALAVFALADTLREGAREMVAALHRSGIRKVVMLTGDQEAVARSIAREAGIDEWRAGLLPADKVREIRRLKEEGAVMMVGDGVNDAPALAAADLGVAMGAAGTDIAMETADVVLMGDRLEHIPELTGMARHARRVLMQNLTFAGSVIAVLLVAALGFALPLPIGVIGHEGSTVLVCLNGLRLLGYRPKPLSAARHR